MKEWECNFHLLLVRLLIDLLARTYAQIYYLSGRISLMGIHFFLNK